MSLLNNFFLTIRLLSYATYAFRYQKRAKFRINCLNHSTTTCDELGEFINKNKRQNKRQGGNNQTFHFFPKNIYIDRRAFISIEKFQKPSF